MELSTSQYHLLKKLRHTDLVLSSCSDDEKEDVAFLGSMGFVQYTEISDNKNPRMVIQTSSISDQKEKLNTTHISVQEIDGLYHCSFPLWRF